MSNNAEAARVAQIAQESVAKAMNSMVYVHNVSQTVTQEIVIASNAAAAATESTAIAANEFSAESCLFNEAFQNTGKCPVDIVVFAF